MTTPSKFCRIQPAPSVPIRLRTFFGPKNKNKNKHLATHVSRIFAFIIKRIHNDHCLMAPVASTPKSNSFSAPLKQSTTATWRPTQIPNPPKRTSFAFDTIEDALASFSAGEFLVVMDDENRENEGDLIISASQCTTEKMAWMIKHTRCCLKLLGVALG